MHNPRKFMQMELHTGGRRDAILRILRDTPVRNQGELVRLLRREGHDVTQSSISRDLRELGVLKASGRYLPPSDIAVRTHSDFDMLRQFVRSVATAGSSLVVIKTTVGAAQSVAAAIDKAEWPEVVGTISGDDTIFLATDTARAQSQAVNRLRDVFRLAAR
jgi:transcriptional regulator of arginine metabolism